MRIARVHAQALAVRKGLAHLAVAVGMGLGEPLGCLAFRLKVVHVEDNNAHGNSFTWVEKILCNASAAWLQCYRPTDPNVGSAKVNCGVRFSARIPR